MPREVLTVLGGIKKGVCDAENGCEVDIDLPLIRIRGASREVVFDAASALVRGWPRDMPRSVSAILHTPTRPSGFDRWSIIIGADVAFSPTGLGAEFPRVPA